jgi:hypothetical protein
MGLITIIGRGHSGTRRYLTRCPVSGVFSEPQECSGDLPPAGYVRGLPCPSKICEVEGRTWRIGRMSFRIRQILNLSA